MNPLCMIACATALMFGITAVRAADSHEQRVARIHAELTAKRDILLQSLAELDVSLQAHGIPSKEIPAARVTLDEMMKAAAWRSLNSRTTKTHEEAKATLEKYLTNANNQLAVPRQQLALIKKAEFEAWARANPEAAKLLEIERRTAAALAAASEAESAAGSAQAAAAQAQADAWQAQQDAEEADRRARNAERESQRSKDALSRHGIDSW